MRQCTRLAHDGDVCISLGYHPIWYAFIGVMRMQVQVTRWGNSLGLRLPKELARRLGIAEGSRVEVAAEGDRLVVSVARPVYRLEELLEGVTPEALGAAFDWGPDQ